jgi:hypothetical protein
MDERTRERAYTFHKAKESAYARAGLYAKARSHADRARVYSAYSRASSFGGAYSFGGGEKTHRIFVLAPLNDEAERKLSAMVAESEAYARIEVYLQGFSEPQMHAGVCGEDAGEWQKKGCTNVLPAQFNQYCSDDPLALVHLIKRHSENEKVRFVIMPTQLTKNAAFSEAVVAEHKKLLPTKWRELDVDTKRKIASWHGIALDPADAVPDRLDSAKERLEKMKLKPLFDPFVAYMIHKKDGTSLSRLDVEVGVSALGMPTMRARGPTRPGGTQSPGSGGASNVELVFHATEAEAARDGAEYARYVWDAMTRAVGWRHDGNFVNSVFQDWSDWDNLVSVRCILASLPGDLTLYSVGRPVAPKCDLDFAAKYGGGLHSWPPCRTGNVVDGDVDVTRSTEEAIDVAATWHYVLFGLMTKWYTDAPFSSRYVVPPDGPKPSVDYPLVPVRKIFVVNCGFTKRHGMNPVMHSPIVDIYSAHPARYERNKGAYLGTMSEHERFSGLRAIDFAEIGRVIEAKYYFDD